MEFDNKDAELVALRIIERDKIAGIRLGDYLLMPEGHYVRFTHDWGYDIQTTMYREGKHWDGSFYLGKDGYCSFSGSLDSAIMKDRMVLTEEAKDGHFWMFHHDWVGPHRGVHFDIPCRVYKLV